MLRITEQEKTNNLAESSAELAVEEKDQQWLRKVKRVVRIIP